MRSVFATVDVDTRSIVVAADYLVRYAVDFILYLIVGFTHETLDGVYSTFGVGDGLTFGGVAHFAFATVDECNYRRCCVAAFAVRNYNGVVAFENCDTRVGCA